ncbi:MAG: GNAT family N-acetyltransferase [Vicinamibacterales bacterium]
MTLHDWRDRPAAQVAPLYAAERARWQRDLSWDTAATWAVVEEARTAGRLPGYLVEERGRITGWTFFLLHDDTLQIGALAADEARGVRHLLERVMAAPEGQQARTVSLFLLPGSPALGAALTRRRFTQRVHHYLSLDLAGAAGAATTGAAVRPWRGGDETAAVRLMADAYRGQPSAVCYAPHGRLDEWAWYVRQLLRTPSCGLLRPDLTFVAAGTAGAPAGVVLTTAIDRRTAHIAQVAVAPGTQGRGVGRALVTAAIARARELGYERLTLMVAEDNARARHLYDTLGFTPGPAFLYAARPLPSRLARAS